MSAPDSEPSVLIERTVTYTVVRSVMAAWYRVYFRRRIEARDHLPLTGGLVLACNHQSFLDIPLVAVSTRRHVAFVARATLARSGILAFVMRECGAVLVNRGQSDVSAMRAMVEHLRRGDCLCIFPEGSRSMDGRLQPFHAGALVAARKAEVPILPVGIRGTCSAWPRGTALPKPHRVALRFGELVDSAKDDALETVRTQIEAMVGDGHFASVPPLPV